jgi:UDP-GlcNAc:undecaprenyl-phosphate GlcNAc-1-phosphate transferase
LVGSALLSSFLTPVALRVAVRNGIYDHPSGYKAQAQPVPYLGGMAIIVAFAIAVLAAALVTPPVSGVAELATILGLGVALGLVGLVDDLRTLGPWVRLATQLVAAWAVWATGAGVNLFGQPVFDGLLTMLWVVGITNAFNLLDNMDGLSAGVAAIAAGWFFVIAAFHGQFLVAALAIALAGCALGFLRHNFHPARIYMGDAGSLFLGFVLAVIGIKLRFEGPTQVTFFVPILVLGVAIFDTTLVTVTRIARRRSPFAGGRDHVSHRLVRLGVPVRGAVGLVYAAAFGLGWLALAMSRVDRVSGMILMGLVLAFGLLAVLLLWRVEVYGESEKGLSGAPLLGRG